MNSILLCILIIAGMEIISVFLFMLLARFNKVAAVRDKQAISLRSVLKGILERAFLVFSFLNDLPYALTFFAALKIATRIKDDDRISNDFYLIGNLVSVTLAIIYSKLIEALINI